MRSVVLLPLVLIALLSRSWGGTPELYEALGSPAGRFLLGELGAERAEGILERVRLRYLFEHPQEQGIFKPTRLGPVVLGSTQRTLLRAALQEEAGVFNLAESLNHSASYSSCRSRFLAEAASPKRLWVNASRFLPGSTDEILAEIRREAISRVQRGERATVVFDLDETGIDNRFGTAAMLLGRDGWVHSPESAPFPRAREALQKLELSQFRVKAEDLFREAGIADEKTAMESAQSYLDSRIHSAAKAIAYGVPYPGFVDYVRELHEAGVRIVYLTGRPASEQVLGTLELLRFFRLPLDENARLFLKHGNELTSVYKANALEALIQEDAARIVAVFDNEPENLFEIQARIPYAKLVFVDTDFTRVPEHAAKGWYRVEHW